MGQRGGSTARQLVRQSAVVSRRTPISPGDNIGAFEVVSELKRGGMGVLLLARRIRPGGFRRHVAIKLIHEHLCDDLEFVHMFLDEARLSAALEHPHLARVEDIGNHHGRYYMVLEYLPGLSLAELVKRLAAQRRRIAAEEALAIVAAVADGLHAAHELVDEDGYPLNVVHRDVSPSNILIGTSGQVKLADFGIAKAADRLAETAAGIVKGTVRYIAPEYARGGGVDRRADVYSLALVLWELLTGRCAPAGPEGKGPVGRTAVPRPGKWVEVPPALDQVVAEALSMDPDARPATARIFRERLLDAVPAARMVDAERISALLASTEAGVHSTSDAFARAAEADAGQASAPTTSRARVVRARAGALPGVALARAIRFGKTGVRRLRELALHHRIGATCALAVALASGWAAFPSSDQAPTAEASTWPRLATDGVSPAPPAPVVTTALDGVGSKPGVALPELEANEPAATVTSPERESAELDASRVALGAGASQPSGLHRQHHRVARPASIRRGTPLRVRRGAPVAGEHARRGTHRPARDGALRVPR